MVAESFDDLFPNHVLVICNFTSKMIIQFGFGQWCFLWALNGVASERFS